MKNRNLDYWNKFYKKAKVQQQSRFALFVYKKLIKLKKKIKMIDIGCGNGRDTIFFIKKKIDIIGLDQSNVIKKNKSIFKKNFVKKNICLQNLNFKKKFDVLYARFFIHAINAKEQKNFFKNVKKIIRRKGLIFLEFRTIKDPLIKKGIKISKHERYDGHYRRFINPHEFKNEMKKMSYKIIYFKTSNKYAVYHNQRPHICRVILKKIN